MFARPRWVMSHKGSTPLREQDAGSLRSDRTMKTQTEPWTVMHPNQSATVKLHQRVVHPATALD